MDVHTVGYIHAVGFSCKINEAVAFPCKINEAGHVICLCPLGWRTSVGSITTNPPLTPHPQWVIKLIIPAGSSAVELDQARGWLARTTTSIMKNSSIGCTLAMSHQKRCSDSCLMPTWRSALFMFDSQKRAVVVSAGTSASLPATVVHVAPARKHS